MSIDSWLSKPDISCLSNSVNKKKLHQNSKDVSFGKPNYFTSEAQTYYKYICKIEIECVHLI